MGSLWSIVREEVLHRIAAPCQPYSSSLSRKRPALVIRRRAIKADSCEYVRFTQKLAVVMHALLHLTFEILLMIKKW